MSPHLLTLSLDETLAQGELLLASVSNEQYGQKVPVAFNASIGEHYRHALEHVILLIAQHPESSTYTPVLDYDLRPRDPRIQTDRSFAMSRTQELRADLKAWTHETLFHPITLKGKTSYDPAAPSVEIASNLSREVMFVISHSVHHYALIGLMCGLLEIPLPEGFGVAPSTLKHQSTAAKT